ncbi:MAG TPA: hypothetical protein V6D11_03885 [Waterburya sp.]|jgi:hypothetical protein
MSQEQQKQPQSERSQPQMPQPESAADQSTRVTVQRTDNREKPLLQTQTLKVLRGTIGFLEGIVEKLEGQPVQEISSQVASPTTKTVSVPVVDTTTAMPEAEWEGDTLEAVIAETPAATPEVVVMDTPTLTPEPTVAETPAVTPEVVASDTPTVVPEPVIAETPAVTPEVVLSDTPTLTPEIVTETSAQEQISEPIEPQLPDRILPSFNKLQAFWDATLAKVRSILPAAWNAKVSDWGLTSAIAGLVVVILVSTATLVSQTPPQEAQVPPPTIEAPPELKAPKPPQPVAEEPPPVPELTPEQSLIAAIQQQVAEITEQYGNGLIQSIEANFLGSRLVVKISDGWYSLKEAQQNKLANEILRRAQELDFSKLEVTDLKGTLVARSPVVGSNMVILKRQDLAAT